jgi:hypothetical protein
MAYTIPDQREVPAWLRRGQQPSQAVAELIRRQQAALVALRHDVDDARAETAAVVESVGLAVHRKLGTVGASEFRTILDALTAAGAAVVTHVGEPFEGELEELADVVDWIEPGDGAAPGCVAEAFEPEIRLHGRLIHRAKLICVTEESVTEVRDEEREQG